MEPHDRLIASLRAHPAFASVRLVGSRATGDPTALSDWDIELLANDPARLRAELPGLGAALDPLAAGWDPNGERPTYMLLLAGPRKIDLILADERQPRTGARHEVSAESLPRFDHHFWDWTLWLAAKRLRGRADLVDADLRLMHEQLLGPMGVPSPPPSIRAAIAAYRRARRRAATRLGVAVDDRLDAAVAPAILGALPERA